MVRSFKMPIFSLGSAPHPPVSPCRVNHPDPESLERRDYSSSIGSQNALIPDLPTDLTLDIIQNMDEKYADIDHITASEDMSEAAKVCNYKQHKHKRNQLWCSNRSKGSS